MELIEIEAFVTIADAGTFTRAAGQLRISQPAVSRRMDLLEVELGAQLFERLRTGTRLTDAGQAFLPFARQALADLQDGAAAVRDATTGSSGPVTLALVGTLASTSLIDRLRVFRQAWPGVRLMMQTANSDEVSRLVRTGDVQLGLRYYDDPAPALECVRVADERLVIACSSQSRLVPAEVRLPSEIATVPWVSFPVGAGSSGEPLARSMDRYLTQLGLADAERIMIDSLTAQKRLIEADFGIGMLPESAITEELRLGTLRILHDLDFNGVAPVVLIRRAGGHRSGAMVRLTEALANNDNPFSPAP